jgi:hypothetical protein
VGRYVASCTGGPGLQSGLDDALRARNLEARLVPPQLDDEVVGVGLVRLRLVGDEAPEVLETPNKFVLSAVWCDRHPTHLVYYYVTTLS